MTPQLLSFLALQRLTPDQRAVRRGNFGVDELRLVQSFGGVSTHEHTKARAELWLGQNVVVLVGRLLRDPKCRPTR